MGVSVYSEQYVKFFQLFLLVKRLNIYPHPSIKQEQVRSSNLSNYHVEHFSMLELAIDKRFKVLKVPTSTRNINCFIKLCETNAVLWGHIVLQIFININAHMY